MFFIYWFLVPWIVTFFLLAIANRISNHDFKIYRHERDNPDIFLAVLLWPVGLFIAILMYGKCVWDAINNEET